MPAKLFIATPAYGGVVRLKFHASYVAMLKSLWRAGIATEEAVVEGTGISANRDALAAAFLRDQTCTHLLMIDSDMVCHADAAERALARGKECVGAIYPKRALHFERMKTALKEGRRFEDALLFGLDFIAGPSGEVEVSDNLLKLRGIGMGFALIARSAFERIVLAGKAELYDSPDWPGGKRYGFFQEIPRAGRLPMPDDLSFCARLIEAGGEVWGDPFLVMGHVGEMVFTGRYADLMRLEMESQAAPTAVK